MRLMRNPDGMATFLAVVLALAVLLAGSPARTATPAPVCSVCGRPVSGKVLRLSDGRLLCAEDAARAVLDEAQARTVFWAAVAAVNSALGPGMKLKAPIEAVNLVDRNGMRRVASQGGQVNGQAALGLFRLRTVEGRSSLTVYLLSGLLPERLATVAAHEYAHSWQAENNPQYREASRKVREGFAEWVAWSVNTSLGRKGELAFMARQRDPDYVDGLKLYRALERAGGREAALRSARTRVR